MPRATRNGGAPRDPSESPELHREALQPKTANALKRSLDEDEAAGPAKKKTSKGKGKGKGKSSSHKTEPSASAKDLGNGAAPLYPRVTGHYAISISEVAKHYKFDTSSYTVTLFHHSDGEESQLFAEFKFDHLKGIMRLLPEVIFNSKGDAKWDAYDFVDHCKLAEDVRPLPELSKWLMRWRGQDGGMRLNERVGGEPWNAPGSVNFKFEDETPEDGMGLRFHVVFAYDCKLFSFCGTKVRDLEECEVPDLHSMEERWEKLDNRAWYEDEEPEPQMAPEPQSDNFFDVVTSPASDQRGESDAPQWEHSESDAGSESSTPTKRTFL